MKILSCMFGIKKGGLERVFLDYERAFIDLGYESSIIASEKFEDLKNIKSKNLYKTKYNSIFYPHSYYHIIKCINKYNPDLIFMHGNKAIELVCNKFVKYFIKNKNVKFIATTHNNRNKRFKRLNYSIAISDELEQDLINRGINKSKIFKCSNGIELQKENIKFSYHTLPVIVAMGRLHTVKGYDILIKAFNKIISEGTKAKLIIAGDGKEEENLKNLIKELNIEQYVKILPWPDNINEFFKDIDIFCLSSRSEGMPLSLLEAMSFSKPCIATDCPGVIEVLNNYNAGIIVKRENIDDLAKGLKKLVTNEELGKELSKKGYQTIKDFYSQDILKNNLESIVKSIDNK